MLKFLRRFFAYPLSRKVKTIEQFVQVMEEEKLRSVAVGAKLDAGGLVNETSGKMLFCSTLPSGRAVTYEELLFEHFGLPEVADAPVLFLRVEQKIMDLQKRLPTAAITFDTLYLPNGRPVPITSETTEGFRRLAIKEGVV